MTMTAILRSAARNGRLILVLGLFCGVGLPQLAQAMKPWLPALVAILLLLAAVRIGLRQVLGGLADMRASLSFVLVLQIAMPLALYAIARAAGLGAVSTTAVVLMAAAAPLLGSSNLTILTGNDPAAALRLLIVGLALLPLTIIPTLMVLPSAGGIEDVAMASVRLLGLVIGVAGLGFALRNLFFDNLTTVGTEILDGTSAIAMAVVVIGLMAAIGPALRSAPLDVFWTFCLALACCIGLQLLTYGLAGAAGSVRNRVAYAIVAGNRNMAFFLAALPASVMEPLLLFIGCYQIPMYLTPVLLGRLYRNRRPSPADGP